MSSSLHSSSDQKSLHLSRSKGYELLAQMRNDLVDPLTGKIIRGLVEHRSCPVCGSGKRSFLLLKSGGEYHKCDECTMVYLDPVLTDENLDRYYRKNLVIQAKAHEEESDFYCAIYSEGIRVLRSAGASGRLLDVGCSGGTFMSLARNAGFDVVGIELNAAEVAIARQKSLDVREVTLEQLDFDEKFDVITLWDVFEHIKNPHSFLSTLRTRTSPGGLIFMQIPSSASLSARVLQAQCNMFDGVEHVNLFGPTSIRRLMDMNGLEVLFLESVIDDCGPLLNYLSYESPYEGSFNPDSSLSVIDPDMILKAGLGYKLQLIVRPKFDEL